MSEEFLRRAKSVLLEDATHQIDSVSRNPCLGLLRPSLAPSSHGEGHGLGQLRVRSELRSRSNLFCYKGVEYEPYPRF
jgi:hypothetical protein